MFESEKRRHFNLPVDTEISPRKAGKMAAARGISLTECPYDEPRNIMEWQNGWRSMMNMLIDEHSKAA